MDALKPFLDEELRKIRDAGLYKDERVIQTPQGARIQVAQRDVLNFCANNYLGLSSHPELIRAAHEALDRWGYGLSSVRFICGTQTLHKELETTIARFFGSDDAILYTSCFDATMDAAFEMRIDSWKLWSPLTIFYALFGYFLSERTGGMAIFEKPPG